MYMSMMIRSLKVCLARRTVLPEEQGDITQAVARTNGGSVAAHGEMTQLVETNGQVPVLTTERESGICRRTKHHEVG